MIPLGPFDLERPIGHGGMGEVWWARHRAQGLDVAVKLLTVKGSENPAFRRAFRNEVRAVAGLDHPTIVRVFDYGDSTEETEVASKGKLRAGIPYLAMELVPDGTLSQLRGRITWSELRATLEGLLDALAHAHARGVVHRDLKPGNVLLSLPGPHATDGQLRVKLTDFGLAHALDGEPVHEDELRKLSGTPAYMAPEQFRGDWRSYGPWTDLYALGCVVWSIITGDPLFGRTGNVNARAFSHIKQAVPPLQARLPLPSDFEPWLRTLLAKRPDRRFTRAADALWALRQVGDVADATPPSHQLLPEGERPTQLTPFSARSSLPAADHTTLTFDIGDLPNELPVEGTRLTPRPPPLPSSWRDRHVAPEDPRLSGAGLGLYGLRSVPIVGREEERNTLWDALRRVSRTQSAEAVVLQGASGCGKSRLARWIGERAHEVGAASVLRATHSSIPGAASGLAPMMVRHLGCIELPRDGMLDRIEFLHGRDGEPDPLHVQGLAELMMPSDPDDGPQLVRFSSATERYVVLQRELRRICSARPCVVWLDDVQWGLDALQFATWVLREARDVPVLFVCTAMSEALSERALESTYLEELVELDGVTALEIGPIPPRHRSSLVRALLGLESQLEALIEARSAGNPLFAEQLVGDLVERGLLEPSPSGFRLVAGATIELPDDVHQAWKARIERLIGDLSHKETLALELAATLGESVDREEWTDVCRRAGADPSPDLVERVLSQHVAVAHPGGPEVGWSFVHGMVRESLERRAAEHGRMQTLHRLCANLLEDRPGADRAERLGRHLLKAGDAEAALEPLLEGARSRVASGDYSQAEALISARERALQTLHIPTSDRRWVQGWMERFTVDIRRVRYDEAGRWLDKLSAPVAAGGWLRESIEAAIHRAHLCRIRGQLRDGVTRLATHEADAVALGSPRLVGRLRWELAEGLAELAELERAKALLARAQDDFATAGDERGEAWCRKSLSEVLKVEGHYAEAATLMQKALAGFEHTGYRWAAASCKNSLGDIERYRGNLGEAEQLYRDAGQLFRAIGSGSWVYTDYNHALTQLTRHRPDEARVVLARCLEEFARHGRMTAVADAHLALAGCASLDGDWTAWDFHIGESCRLAEQTEQADEDTARLAELVATWAAEADQPERARVGWTIAAAQWSLLGRAAEVASAEQQMIGLPSPS